MKKNTEYRYGSYRFKYIKTEKGMGVFNIVSRKHPFFSDKDGKVRLTMEFINEYMERV